MTQADHIILNYPEHKIKKNRVNLHYYHAEWQDGVASNLGDYISEVVVKELCRKNGISFEKQINNTKHLYGIGSILQMGYQNATVWGTGFAFELSTLRSILHKWRKLDIRCVRGPKTRKTLLKLGFECPENYGDPGILMPFLYEPNVRSRIDYLIIPHFSVEENARKKYGDEHILSMNTKDYRHVIDCICSAEKVISSSLHGIILAEAYGVPAVFYQDRPQKFNYKYDDWYESTGRNVVEPAESADTGMTIRTEKINSRRLKEMQNMLMDKFPLDLWCEGGGYCKYNIITPHYVCRTMGKRCA